jgi:anti-anti-sigma factor
MSPRELVSNGHRPDHGSRAPTGLTISETGAGVIRLVGELDTASAPQLRRRLASGTRVRVIDMEHVTFIDCRGISALVSANRNQPDSSPITLQAPSRCVLRLLHLCELEASFNIRRSPAPGTC